MWVQPIQKTTKMPSAPKIYLVVIVLGILSGASSIQSLHTLGQVLSDLFIRMFQCISLPIIALSMIVTLSTYSAEDAMKKVWRRTVMYTLGTTLIAALVSCLLYCVIRPSNVNHIGRSSIMSITHQINYWTHLSSLVPTNIFSPFIDHQVMGVLLVGIVVGIAIRYIPDEACKKTMTSFFQGAHGLLLVITRWILAIIPLGLYGFITVTVIQLRQGMDLKGIGEYLTVVVLANIIQGFVILPLWLRSRGIQPFDAMQKMLPALSLAFFSKSSAGTLPVTVSTAEKNLGLNHKVSRFVLPLCTSINMNGCAAFIFATVIYLMQNYGVPITFGTMLMWVIIATIAAVGNAGVPMGCFFLSASLLASMNIPIPLLGVILPFYSIIDMIETSLNVWSDSCVAMVVNQHIETKEIF